ncbi:hypothetical protein O9H85_14440 [Paenibacillus filicis]|uniref:Fungal lipase-type domain-containing protein n=1 Tax=Paenibacillus gyeongsangnamensis TaxID=3388067 RepID=A0ABT4Q9Q1_9BACL|nr:hypothetical protein [Paenibacillus filicis]MCZ8513612.1 hypothetical protein [Paenibacillus filicis]
MSRAFKPAGSRKVAFYCLAGVATAPLFMEVFRRYWMEHYAQLGFETRSELLFPYGDWSRHWIRQLPEAYTDLRTSGSAAPAGRARLMAEAIAEASPPEEALILCGHSAGGAMAVLTASLLKPDRAAPIRVIQIGSPRCAVPDNLKEDVLYLYGVNAAGRSIDPVTRLGSWGGWERGRLPRWNARRTAPATICAVSLIGGHADYFRTEVPFILPDGRSNLEHTAAPIRSWLRSDEIRNP